MAKEELFWKEKARTRWNKEGDINTSYFHKVPKIKRFRNKIINLNDGNIIITDLSEIVAHAVNYYTNIFGFEGNPQDNYLTNIIPSLVLETMNKILTILPYKEEITSTIFGLRKENSLRHDGFGGVFFQTYRNIIQDDVFNAIHQFFKFGWMIPNYNVNTKYSPHS